MGREEAVEAYYKLRATIDTRSEELSEMHKDKLACKKGCDSCCESINVFPLEFEAIRKELGQPSLKAIPKRMFNGFRKSCVFLIDGACSIYNSRPIICRTQGLPLLYQNSDGTAYELSVCHLNFKGINPSVFNTDNALYMPEYNSKLFLLNQEFVKHENYSPTKRVPLYSLL